MLRGCCPRGRERGMSRLQTSRIRQLTKTRRCSLPSQDPSVESGHDCRCEDGERVDRDDAGPGAEMA